jgi:UDP-N-acetylmuramate dehydrogenase
MQIRENEPLAGRTTLGVGGAARWFVEAASEAEVVAAARWARERGLKLFVLGGGSNLLVADEGFDGLVLAVALQGIAREKDLVRAAAGEEWDHVVSFAVEQNLAGLECLAGIPGTAGGTPVQNVGAYGCEAGESIERVHAYDLESGGFVEFTRAECGFGYRRSRFNAEDRGRYVVTRVDYRLRADGVAELKYADLKTYFADRETTPTLVEVAVAVRTIRRRKGMLMVDGDADCRSAGSFFKNPSVAPEKAAELRAWAAGRGLALRTYPAADGQEKIQAAWLIEQAGFPKGYAMGAAGISSRHTLALINRGGARAAEIVALAERIRAGVAHQFGIALAMEPVRLGF